MKLCRFQQANGPIRAGLIADDTSVADLTSSGIESLGSLLHRPSLADELRSLASQNLPRHPLDSVRLLTPVERQEVWAAGVTYLRSKRARMEESEIAASAYDLVYDAARPELFFKSLPEKVVSPGQPVGIRRDATWNVPEPELALVLAPDGKLVGYTIGNDMSSRDIEGENTLYLPQAKVYRGSCAVGPVIRVGATETEAREWTISLEILRSNQTAFEGRTTVSQIKRSFQELADYLFRSQLFPNGAILLTGTGIVPGDDFSLLPGDTVRIQISGVGSLENPVEQV